MFEIGTFVVKANNGICRVEKIGSLDMDEVNKEKKYYFLVPVDEKKAMIYTPVEAGERMLRNTMTEKEAWDLIEKLPSIAETEVASEKLREKEYSDVIKSSDPERIAGLVKTIYFRREERLAAGKKITAVDDKYFRIAVNALHSELAFAIGKEQSEVEELIWEKIEG